MGFLLKAFIALIIVAVGGSFLVNKIPSLKQRVIETINPAAKEARLLGELGSTLDKLESSINQTAELKSPTAVKNKLTASKDILARSKELLKEVSDVNDQNSGIISSTLGRIVDTLIDRAPFPADHLKINAATDENVPVNCP